MMGSGKVFMMCSTRDGRGAAGGSEGYGGWILDIVAWKWIRVETLAKFSGFTYSLFYLETDKLFFWSLFVCDAFTEILFRKLHR